ncbi:MAG TPA: DUF4190 domain-containing protein [Acidimicrobiales bacterium]|nr:DUF4190 domain-containing protein [Acidimicrobiales bacterium]
MGGTPAAYPQPGGYPAQPGGYPAQPGGYPPPPGGYPPHPGGYWPGGYPQTRATNGLAIASMVCGILWLAWLGSLLAVIFGHVSLHQIKRSGQGGRGMAIAGLILGYLGIAVFIIAVIAAAASGNNNGS